MNKKYPGNTHVTLEMLVDILTQANYQTTAHIVKSMIEPPKLEPKDGEWWMCRYKDIEIEGNVVLTSRNGKWVNMDSSSYLLNPSKVTPLYKMVQEKEAE